MNKPICKRCLSESIDYEGFMRSLDEYIESYPKEKSCTTSEYSHRLSICGKCENLKNEMCALCGCYVKLRALKINSRCPNVGENKWRENK
ncbi:MAG: DUF6171 family protein [Ruminococcus sp.]|nr:DUF6171 family protein [Ruminococcus sp.]